MSVFAEADLRALQLLFDEAVAVEVIAGPKRKERAHPHDHRAEHLVADVEIVVGEAAALGSEDPVIGVLAGVLWYSDAKGGTLLHTLEDKIDAVGVLSRHAALPGQDMIFLAHPLLGPLDRQPMVAGEGFHPGLVVGGALSEDLFIHRGDADHVAEEVHHLLGSRQAAQVTVYDDAIEAVVDKGQQVAEQLGEQFHGLPPPRPAKGRKTFKRGPRQRIVEGRSFRLADEVRYIQRRAAEHDSRIVTIAQLVLFSTQTGDAWLLDSTDRLALRLARDGQSQAIHLEETDTTFAIAWKGRYRIDGPAFIYSDRDTGRTTAILGYPIDKLARTAWSEIST